MKDDAPVLKPQTHVKTNEFNCVLIRVMFELSIYKALRLSFQHAVFLHQLENALMGHYFFWNLIILIFNNSQKDKLPILSSFTRINRKKSEIFFFSLIGKYSLARSSEKSKHNRDYSTTPNSGNLAKISSKYKARCIIRKSNLNDKTNAFNRHHT